MPDYIVSRLTSLIRTPNTLEESRPRISLRLLNRFAKMKALLTATFLVATSLVIAGERHEKEQTSLPWWIEHYSNKDGTFLLVGDAKIPMDWFLKASPTVKRNIQSWFFILSDHSINRVIGTLNEDREFVTWPGAKVFAKGEYPEGYIFVSPNRDDSDTQTSVSF